MVRSMAGFRVRVMIKLYILADWRDATLKNAREFPDESLSCPVCRLFLLGNDLSRDPDEPGIVSAIRAGRYPVSVVGFDFAGSGADAGSPSASWERTVAGGIQRRLDFEHRERLPHLRGAVDSEWPGRPDRDAVAVLAGGR